MDYNKYIKDNIIINNINGKKCVNNNTGFLFIRYNSKATLDLLKILIPYKNGYIYKPNPSLISKILYYHELNPAKFCPLGDNWFHKDNCNDKFIVLVNKNRNFSSNPIDFIKVDNFDEYSIWKPVCRDGYEELGLVVSSFKPSLNSMRVINKDIIKENGYKNELNLLFNPEIKNFSLDKNKINRLNLTSSNILLQESVNPWYINKKKNIEESLLKENKNESSGPPKVLTTTSKILNLERFNIKYDFNILACSLLILIIVLVLVRFYINKNMI